MANRNGFWAAQSLFACPLQFSRLNLRTSKHLEHLCYMPTNIHKYNIYSGKIFHTHRQQIADFCLGSKFCQHLLGWTRSSCTKCFAPLHYHKYYFTFWLLFFVWLLRNLNCWHQQHNGITVANEILLGLLLVLKLCRLNFYFFFCWHSWVGPADTVS